MGDPHLGELRVTGIYAVLSTREQGVRKPLNLQSLSDRNLGWAIPKGKDGTAPVHVDH